MKTSIKPDVLRVLSNLATEALSFPGLPSAEIRVSESAERLGKPIISAYCPARRIGVAGQCEHQEGAVQQGEASIVPNRLKETIGAIKSTGVWGSPISISGEIEEDRSTILRSKQHKWASPVAGKTSGRDSHDPPSDLYRQALDSLSGSESGESIRLPLEPLARMKHLPTKRPQLLIGDGKIEVRTLSVDNTCGAVLSLDGRPRESTTVLSLPPEFLSVLSVLYREGVESSRQIKIEIEDQKLITRLGPWVVYCETKQEDPIRDFRVNTPETDPTERFPTRSWRIDVARRLLMPHLGCLVGEDACWSLQDRHSGDDWSCKIAARFQESEKPERCEIEINLHHFFDAFEALGSQGDVEIYGDQHPIVLRTPDHKYDDHPLTIWLAPKRRE